MQCNHSILTMVIRRAWWHLTKLSSRAAWKIYLPGGCKSVDLLEGREIALYHVNGEFYATENFCPHKGAPLAEGILCEHVIECDWHGWQFDVRTGECLTVTEKLETYEVAIEEGLIKVLV